MAISPKVPHMLITKITLEINYLRFHSNLPGANGLIKLTIVVLRSECYVKTWAIRRLMTLQWRHIERCGVSNHQLTTVYSTVYSWTDQRKHQSTASLVFVRGIHRWPVDSPHKGPVTRNMFPFDDVIMVPSLSVWRSHGTNSKRQPVHVLRGDKLHLPGSFQYLNNTENTIVLKSMNSARKALSNLDTRYCPPGCHCMYMQNTSMIQIY